MQIKLNLNYKQYMNFPNKDELKRNFKYNVHTHQWTAPVSKHILLFINMHKDYIPDYSQVIQEISNYFLKEEHFKQDIILEVKDKYPFLYNFQRDIVSNILLKFTHNKKGVNIWQEVGIGKTIQALCVMDYIYTKKIKGFYLIVCPKNLFSQWKSEMSKFKIMKDEKCTVINGNKKTRRDKWLDKSSRIKLITYESFKNDSKDKLIYTHITSNCKVMLFDESTKFKNMRTQTWKQINKCVSNCTDVFVCSLTGTPIVNKLSDAFTQNCIIDKNTYKGQIGLFNAKHAIYNEFEQFGRILNIIVGYKHPQKFLDYIQSHTYVVKKQDVKEQLPKEQEIYKTIDITKNQRKISREIYEYLEDKESTSSIFEVFSILKMLDDSPYLLSQSKSDTAILFSESLDTNDLGNKLDQLLLDISEIGDNQCLIFAHHLNTVNMVYKKIKDLGYDIQKITSDTCEKYTNNRIHNFKIGETQILIVSDCLSHGISFPDVDFLINYDLPFTIGDYEQRKGRICRINSINNKTIINYIGPIIGNRMYDILKNKKKVASNIDKYKYLIGGDKFVKKT